MGFLEWALAFADTWGDMADVFGVLIAVVGFSATVWSAWRAKTASEQARTMVEKLREESRRMDFVSECAAAIGVMNQIKVFHRDHAFIALLSHYPLLRVKLVTIKNFPGLTDHQRIDIQKFMTTLTRMEEVVEKCQLSSGNATLDVAKYNKNIAEHADLLQDVMTIIKTSSTE
jgi:hypothetical protein